MLFALASIDRLETAFQNGIRPDPEESLADWCDANIELPQGRHAEAGRWRTARTPFLKEPMDELSPGSLTEEVVVMKGAQLGFTQIGVHWAGYIMKRAPGSILMCEPTTDIARKISKQRLQPMLTGTPALQGVVREARTRDSGNTLLMKEFNGGDLVITGANSGVGLRFMSARYLMLDEVDGYPPDCDGEGPPTELARNRLATFARSKIFTLSTPLDRATSIIEPAYDAGSRGRYHVPCPLCLQTQWLKWGQIVFTFDGVKDPNQTAYRCEHCNGLILEHHKTWMLEMGRWVHEDFSNPVKSYHLSSLYAPFGWKKVSWSALVKEFLHASERAKRGDTRFLKKFVNTKLAQTWEEKGETVDKDVIWHRRETYEASCPEGVLVVTAAVDIQDDRVECEACGWGLGEESWSLDYQRFYGSPAQPDLWRRLDEWLHRTWKNELGMTMHIQRAVIDSGGHYTNEVYKFVRPRQARGIAAIKGSSQTGHPLVGRPSKHNIGNVNLFPVGTDTAKDTVFARMKLDTFGPGYMHFPMLPTYDEEYFAQLTAEEKRQKIQHGIVLGYQYKKTRARNEALDLKVYNLAALAIMNPNLEALASLRKDLPPAPPPPERESSPWLPYQRADKPRNGWMTRGR